MEPVTVSPRDLADDRSEFEASAMWPVFSPSHVGECRHVFQCKECGPHEVWVHENFELTREWANTIFQLANTDSVSEGLALSAIRAAAVALANQANDSVNGTGSASILEKRPLSAVSSDSGREA
jgi:hypothetical protein